MSFSNNNRYLANDDDDDGIIGDSDPFPYEEIQDPKDELAREIWDLTDYDKQQGNDDDDDDDKVLLGNQSKSKSSKKRRNKKDNDDCSENETVDARANDDYMIPTVPAVLVTEDLPQQAQLQASQSTRREDLLADMPQKAHEIAHSSPFVQQNRVASTITSSTSAASFFGLSTSEVVAGADRSSSAISASSMGDNTNVLLELHRMQQLLEEKERQQEEKERQQQEEKLRRQKWLLVLLLVSVLAGVAIAVGVVKRKRKEPDIIVPSSAIQTTQELYDMVDLWLNGSFTSDSTWAATYGYPIGQWDVSSITDFSFLFAACSLCDYPQSRNPLAANFKDDISTWNVSSARNMSFLLYFADAFNGDISQWNVANVVDMSGMFWDAGSFNGDISQWNVANVVGMSWMFWGADSFHHNLCAWADILPSNAETHGAFWDTSCPNTTSPDLFANPKGAFCYNCA